MIRFYSTLLRLFTICVCVVFLFVILYKYGYSPIYTDSMTFDLKADHVEEHALDQIDVIAIGSSITLYNLDSKTLLEGKKYTYYNFASWGLQMIDIEMILRNRLRQYHPKYVIMCSNITDFQAPANRTYPEFFDTELPLIKRFKPALYYFNYHSVFDLIIRKRHVTQITTDFDHEYSMRLDNYGGASLNVPKENLGEKYYTAVKTFPTSFTAENYEALRKICVLLNKMNIKPIFVQSPTGSRYMKTSNASEIFNTHQRKCKWIIEKHGGIYLNFHNPTIFSDNLFVDQFHLQRTGAIVLTKKVVGAISGILN
jgi:hypothetical protein